jgi:hypothetical protein
MRKANPERGKLAGWKQESDAKQQESRQRKQESRLWENRKDRAGKNRKRMESVSEGRCETDFSVWLRGHTEVIRRSADRVKERGGGGERSSYERRVAGKPGRYTRQYFHYITLREEESTNCQGPVPYLFLSYDFVMYKRGNGIETVVLFLVHT